MAQAGSEVLAKSIHFYLLAKPERKFTYAEGLSFHALFSYNRENYTVID